MASIHEHRKLHLCYRDAAGAETDRVTWPLGLFFWGSAWTLLAWCELREDFRSFRLERMHTLKVLEEPFADVRGRRLIDYFRWLETTHDVPLSDFDPDQ